MFALIGTVTSTDKSDMVATANAVFDFKPLADLIPYILGFLGGFIVLTILWKLFTRNHI